MHARVDISQCRASPSITAAYATGGDITTTTQAFGVRTDFLFDRLIFMALSSV